LDKLVEFCIFGFSKYKLEGENPYVSPLLRNLEGIKFLSPFVPAENRCKRFINKNSSTAFFL